MLSQFYGRSGSKTGALNKVNETFLILNPFLHPTENEMPEYKVHANIQDHGTHYNVPCKKCNNVSECEVFPWQALVLLVSPLRAGQGLQVRRGLLLHIATGLLLNLSESFH